MVRVLVASDGSEFAIAAAQRAIELLRPDVEATVLAVVPPPVVPSGSVMAEGVAPLAAPDTAAEVDEALTDEARNGLERTVAALGRPVERRLVHGDPAAEICRVAAEEGFDLIVVGSHGFGFVKRVLMGSVSHHVLRHAPCPVLVVRGQD